jgi:hypothetical protein
MQSAAISRAADTVLIRCCATRISSRYTGNVDNRDLGAGGDDLVQQASITVWVRSL